MRQPFKTKFFIIGTTLVLFCMTMSSCAPAKPLSLVNGSGTEPLPEAEVIFQVLIAGQLNAGESLALELLDEVTGLAMNSIRYPMTMIDTMRYFVRVNLPLGALVKYRYVKLSSVPVPEYSTKNEPVRYRLFYVYGPAVLQDITAGWMDFPYNGNLGKIQGQVVTAENVPVGGLMISIAGLTAFTGADGRYFIDNIPEGSHNLVALSLDGAYQIFQQGAVIASDSVTPANFQVTPSSYVHVTFTVTPPSGDYANKPIRLVGSLFQLGNSFTDLNGGLSVLANQAPKLTFISGDKYGVVLQLPVGAYIEYKYTLGDGFWNAEHDANGGFRIRKMIVPQNDTVFDDTIANWGIGGNSPINFILQVPENTPAADFVSIQLNPFTWTNPLPMWYSGANQWSYTLFSPLDILSEVAYRYCRNEQCGVEFLPEDITYGSGPVFSTLPSSQTVNDKINRWPDLQ